MEKTFVKNDVFVFFPHKKLTIMNNRRGATFKSIGNKLNHVNISLSNAKINKWQNQNFIP